MAVVEAGETPLVHRAAKTIKGAQGHIFLKRRHSSAMVAAY